MPLLESIFGHGDIAAIHRHIASPAISGRRLWVSYLSCALSVTSYLLPLHMCVRTNQPDTTHSFAVLRKMCKFYYHIIWSERHRDSAKVPLMVTPCRLMMMMLNADTVCFVGLDTFAFVLIFRIITRSAFLCRQRVSESP